LTEKKWLINQQPPSMVRLHMKNAMSVALFIMALDPKKDVCVKNEKPMKTLLKVFKHMLLFKKFEHPSRNVDYMLQVFLGIVYWVIIVLFLLIILKNLFF